MKLGYFIVASMVFCLIGIMACAGQRASGVSQQPAGANLSKMVPVPAGEFTMGSDSGRNDKPAHKVHLDVFQIDEYEVTNNQYAACVKAGRCEAAHFDDGTCFVFLDDRWKMGKLAQSFRGGNQPVVCVDWVQAKAYCEWAGKRLPTEAEWEKAARGTDGRKYPWGNQDASCSYAIMDDGGMGCGKNSTWPVGSKPNGASPYGAMDMAGNVWEWVADWYDKNYYQSSPNRNPTGPGSGEDRVVRGGCWIDNKETLHSSARDGKSDIRVDFLGLRCAGTP